MNKLIEFIRERADKWDREFGNTYTYPCKEVYKDAPERVLTMATRHKMFNHQTLVGVIEKIVKMNDDVYDPIGLTITLEDVLKRLKEGVYEHSIK